MTTGIQNVIWQQLPLEDILHLCETNKTFSQICTNPLTWSLLLKRDFNIHYTGGDAQTKYMLEYVQRKYNRLKKKILYIIFFNRNIIATYLADSIQSLYKYIANDYNSESLLIRVLQEILDDYVDEIQYQEDGTTIELTAKDVETAFELKDGLVIDTLAPFII